MTLAPGTRLGPYEILESIGSGGMGEVWKARDPRLGRIVAIKRVREQHSERFKQEARSIAALNHPNICQIFDIGDDYLVLEYVEGKPLSSPLPEKEAVRLAIQIASALEEAHHRGIIHRDLKPSNIMVTGKGSAKLLDFGLAKLYERDVSISGLPTADMPATQAGAILGTVAYMSPEQAQGKPADVRSDVFSFGLVLYEMLCGKRAFSGDSNFAVMEAIVRKETPPLKTSPGLEKIVKRCLEKQPSERHQTMSAVKKGLEAVLEQMQSKASAEPQPSIAVIPFADMSPDKDNEWFSDGLAEEIINALTKIPGLQVIARTSAFAFKGKHQDITEIAKALRVSNILEGSVRKAGNRIRVTAQLIEASKGVHLWSERYDRELTDVFAIQDDISQVITEKLRVQLSVNKTLIKAPKKPTENIEAYNLNLKGRYYHNKFTPDDTAKSIEYFEQAIAIDPEYALAWYGLASVHSFAGDAGFSLPRNAIEKSRRASQKALELDNTLPEAHAHLGALLAREFDWKGAEREFLRALDLSPRIIDVSTYYSINFLAPMRRLNDALEVLQKAQELDPLSPIVYLNMGIIYTMLKQYDRAIEKYGNARELDPHMPVIIEFWGITYIAKGELNQAIRIYETNKPLLDQLPRFPGRLGYAYAAAGRTAEAHRILEELQSVAQTTYVSALNFAEIYLGLGERDKSMDFLEKAVEEGDNLISYSVMLFPYVELLSSHPRYKALLKKMNLEP